MLSIVFLVNYNIYMYFVKYTQKPNYNLVCVLFILSSILAGVVAFSLNLFGNIYLYQIVISIIVSIIYLLLCMNFDSSIMTYTEKLGFNVRSSRKYKFYVLFLCLGLYITGFIFKESYKV